MTATTCCSGFFFLIGLALVFAGYRTYRKSDESISWPTTMGTVKTSEVRRTVGANNEFHSYIEYEYSVLGTDYVSNKVTFGELAGFQDIKKSIAQKAVNRYPAGSTVTVYYDPQDPKKAVLQRGGDSALLWLGGAFMVSAVVFYFLQ